MALVMANGLPVLRARLVLPRLGVWWADLAVDSPEGIAPGARVDIDIQDGRMALRATASVAGVHLDTAHLRVLGGAGGLGQMASAKYYSGVPLRLVLQDLLGGAGETLSADANGDVLGAHLPAWSTRAGPVGGQVSALLRAAAPQAAWRVLIDGTLWCGPEAWQAAELQDGELLQVEPAHDRWTYGVEAPSLVPGVTLEGRRVSRVEHLVEPDRVRTIVWLEAST